MRIASINAFCLVIGSATFAVDAVWGVDPIY
jgi:hypothetical protein